MDVEPRASQRECLIRRFDPKMTRPAIEVGEITRFQAFPTALSDARGQHGIEHETARRRQDEAASRGVPAREASSTAAPRALITKRLPASAPRGSLREWRCASRT